MSAEQFPPDATLTGDTNGPTNLIARVRGRIGKLLTSRSTLVGLSFIGQRVLASAIQLMMIPLLVSALGKDGYAAFVMLQIVWNWASAGDFGLAGALQVEISAKRAAGLPYRSLVVTACVTALILALVMTPLAWMAGQFLGPVLLAPFPSIGADQAVTYTFLTVWLSVVTASTVIAYRVWTSEQSGHVTSMAIGAGFIVALGLVWLAVDRDVGSRFTAIIFAYWVPALMIGLGFVVHQLWRGRQSAPWRIVEDSQSLWRRALWLWLNALIYLAAGQLDYVVLSRFANVETMLEYSFVQKIYTTGYFAFNAILMAYVPACSEAMFKNDRDGVRKFLVHMWGYALLICVSLFVVLICWGNEIVAILAPKAGINVPVAYWVAGQFAMLIKCWVDSWASVMVNSNLVKKYVALAPLQAAVGLGLQVVLGQRYGGLGIFAGVALGQLLTSGWIIPVYLMRYRRRQAPAT